MLAHLPGKGHFSCHGNILPHWLFSGKRDKGRDDGATSRRSIFGRGSLGQERAREMEEVKPKTLGTGLLH